jgi:uncharacterized protein
MNEKIENIKILLELNGGKRSYENSAIEIVDAVKHLIPNFSEENFKKEDLEDIIHDIENEIIPIYDKYFTDEEILGIIKFYDTPIGQSYLSKMGIVAMESMKIGNKYGEMIYNKLTEKFKDTH